MQKCYVDITQYGGEPNKLIHLSQEHDPHWAGIQYLAPFAVLQLANGGCSDIYLLQNELHDGDKLYAAGSFIRRCSSLYLKASDKGALFFWYRDQTIEGKESVAPNQQLWLAGRLPGISVAQLARAPHSLSLVLWQPGARTQPHIHPYGEEIWVVEGQLCDELGCYRAGSWLRFDPGEGHAPYVESRTLILLRNGHLSK